MQSVIGNAIVIAILAVAIVFAGRSTIRQLKREAKGEGCSGCGGGCTGCGISSTCSSSKLSSTCTGSTDSKDDK